jgi:hypothetical protein
MRPGPEGREYRVVGLFRYSTYSGLRAYHSHDGKSTIMVVLKTPPAVAARLKFLLCRAR